MKTVRLFGLLGLVLLWQDAFAKPVEVVSLPELVPDQLMIAQSVAESPPLGKVKGVAWRHGVVYFGVF